MIKKITLFIATFITIEVAISQNIGVIPTPQEIEIKQDSFLWNSKNIIFYTQEINNEVTSICNTFVEDINNIVYKTNKEESYLNKTISTNPKKINKGKTHIIELVINKDLSFKENSEQGYCIEIKPQYIKLEAPSYKGLFYATQTLKQLFTNAYLNNSKSIKLPCLVIKDYPSLEYRGWLDDISRGPIPTMDFLKKAIRTMASYKINFFNLYTEHVFKLKSFPDIAPSDGLTKEEIEELTEYAEQYYVEFIANQQCFAHAEKTLKIPYYYNIMDTKYNLNPGTEDTYTFLEKLFSETASAYKSKYFNINCDETEGLGGGKSKRFVDSVGGADNAYVMHINRVYNILKKHNKTVMMWGDIIAKNSSMIKLLPNDIEFIVWSYVDADNFAEHIDPIKESGHPFWVAPGMSMWSTIFPDVNTYIKNIANLVRDGYQAGAKGMMNTAWDDSGESLFNSAWHGMTWAAEMNWKPIVNNSKELADKERLIREKIFNENFNIQHFLTKTEKPTDLIYKIANLKLDGNNISNREWITVASMYEQLLDFFPSKVDSAIAKEWEANMPRINKLADECNNLIESNIDNKEILYNAQYAIERLATTGMKNSLRVNLFSTMNNPTTSNIKDCEEKSEALLNKLHNLKHMYINIWDSECRAYSRDNVTERYDREASAILNAKNYVFINTNISEKGIPVVSLNTVYNNYPIYYTTDGAKPSKTSKKYTQPFEIQQSCIVKTISFDEFDNYTETEKYILHHKGIGHLKKLNSNYSKYNATYSAGGDNALLDGVVGSNFTYKDGHWQGYQGCDVDVEIDFGKQTTIDRISMRFLQNTFDWILSPKEVEIYVSKDGTNYKLLTKKEFDTKHQLSGIIINPLSVEDLNTTTRYLRVVAKNPGVLPEWHPAKGNSSYLFIDEIIIE